MRSIAVKGLEHRCSQLVMGTSFFREKDINNVFELLDTYVENGGNVLDTSKIYGYGESERVIRSWLKTRNRQDVLIISKGCHHYVDQNNVHYPEPKRVRPECITEDLMFSLENMGVDYFDVFLMHRDNPSVPVGELLDKLEEHRQAGLIRAYGVSNWTTRRMDEAISYASQKGYAGLSLNSPSLSLAQITENRWEGTVYADNEYIAWHEKSQLPLFSWAPQASGFFYFASQYKREAFPNAEIARTYYNDDNIERLRRLQELAKRRNEGIEAMSYALAYVLNQEFPTCAVIGPQKPSEMLCSLESARIVLSKEERCWLNLQASELPK